MRIRGVTPSTVTAAASTNSSNQRSGVFVDGNLPFDTSMPISHADMTDTFSVPD